MKRVIGFRAAPELVARIRARARRAGYASLSEYLRAVVAADLAAGGDVPPQLAPVRRWLAEVAALLMTARAAGVNDDDDAVALARAFLAGDVARMFDDPKPEEARP